MSMSKLARRNFARRLNSGERENVANKFGDEFRRQFDSASRGNSMADSARNAMAPVMQAGRSAEQGGRLRQGDSARAMSQFNDDDEDDD